MKTLIDLTVIEAALDKLGQATARQIADETQLELSDVKLALNTMIKRTDAEREKSGAEYLYWLTRGAHAPASKAPTAKPKAAAVAVQSLHTPGGPADLAEQLRQAHAERLAMSQTIVSICCMIGRDPGNTTTAELPQALRDHIEAEIEHMTAGAMRYIDDIRAAVGDNGRIMLDELAAHIKAEFDAGTAAAQANKEATRLMLACNGLTNELMQPAGPFYDQEQGLKAAALLIDAQQAYILQLEAQQAHTLYLEEQVSELRGRMEAQILAGHESASSSARLLTEVHDVLAKGWPVGLEAPTGRTTLQLAQAIAKDFDDLHNTYMATKFPEPDAYLVTRHLRAGRGKTVADSDGPTRHKSIATATRKARAAIRGGYVRVEIHATNLVAVATFGAEIKPV